MIDVMLKDVPEKDRALLQAAVEAILLDDRTRLEGLIKYYFLELVHDSLEDIELFRGLDFALGDRFSEYLADDRIDTRLITELEDATDKLAKDALVGLVINRWFAHETHVSDVTGHPSLIIDGFAKDDIRALLLPLTELLGITNGLTADDAALLREIVSLAIGETTPDADKIAELAEKLAQSESVKENLPSLIPFLRDVETGAEIFKAASELSQALNAPEEEQDWQIILEKSLQLAIVITERISKDEALRKDLGLEPEQVNQILSDLKLLKEVVEFFRTLQGIDPSDAKQLKAALEILGGLLAKIEGRLPDWLKLIGVPQKNQGQLIGAVAKVRGAVQNPNLNKENILTSLGVMSLFVVVAMAAGQRKRNLLAQRGGLRKAAVAVHNLAGNPRAITHSTVVIVEVRMPDGSTQFFSSGSGGRLNPDQRKLLGQYGIPNQNMFWGATYYKGFTKEENHAERIILRNLPKGATVARWGISWAGDQKSVPCGVCEPFVTQAGGTLEH